MSERKDDIAGAGWLGLSDGERRLLRFDTELLSVETGYTVATVESAVARLGVKRATEVLRLANEWGVIEPLVCKAIDMEGE